MPTSLDVDTGAFAGDDAYNFIISARVGGANQDLFIDNLVVLLESQPPTRSPQLLPTTILKIMKEIRLKTKVKMVLVQKSTDQIKSPLVDLEHLKFNTCNWS